MALPDEEVDVVVVGGGPGGSTVATLVSMAGHRVALLEQETFPRHRIGESLLPSTIHGICPLLGVSDEIHNAGFVRKQGGTFRWGKNEEPWTFSFAASPRMSGPTSFAYQVERRRFDAILLNNARRKGVHVRERARVLRVISDDDQRVCGVQWADEHSKTHTVRAKYVVDASGSESLLCSHVAQRIHSEFFQNVALFGYYRNGDRLPAPNSGNILCAAFDAGWFWYIPLTDSLTSVGAVVSREHADVIRQGHAQAMDKFIRACPQIQRYLRNAERVTEGEYGKLYVRKDYSYSSTRFWVPGMALVGDAACFIDPVFSSGVHLSTYSALLAARSINSCLRGTMDEGRAFSEFEMRYRREYANFYKFLVAFYDMNQDEESYFWTARKVLNSADVAHKAFAELVAGVSTSGEPLFGSAEEFAHSMATVSNSFRTAQAAPGEFELTRLDRDFMHSLTQEGMRLQLRAQMPVSGGDAPLWKSGLVPTEDGLRWRTVA